VVVGNMLQLTPGKFKDEKELELYLGRLPECLEEGLSLLKGQFHDGYGFPDLLCLDREGQLVVVEVKYPEAGPDTLTQVLRYLLAVNQKRPEILEKFIGQKKFKHMKDQPPRAIIVAPKISIALLNSMVFVKDNFIDLKEANIYKVAASNTTEVFCKPLNPNIVNPLGSSPQPTIEEILNNTNNGALRKAGDEILKFAAQLGEKGDVSPPRPLSGKIILKCATSTGGSVRIFMRLVPQVTNLKLELRTDTGIFKNRVLASGNAWNAEAKEYVTRAFDVTFGRHIHASETEQSS